MKDTTIGTNRAELDNRIVKFAAAYHADADLRARAEAEPRAVIAENGLEALAPRGADVRIVANTGYVVHIPFPPDPNVEMTDEDFGNMAAGATSAQSAQSAACQASFSSLW